LESKHFGDHLLLSDRNNNTPHDFHQTLCDLIRSAKKRVSLASLYIGPAASPDNQPEEVELLQALSDVASKRKGIPIKVVLDHNRGLRPVPMSNKGTTTSSAKAVAKVINGNVHLFQVLPKPLDSLLPNPLNEVAGVFHIKAYIVDDDLILSGANLSQEYFCDRQDRYLWIRNGGNGLVDFYADVVELLCQHSYTYALDASKDKELLTTSKMSRKEFLQAISRHFQDAAPLPARSLLSKENTAAVGIPTFFAPESFLGGVNPNFVTDTEASLNLLKEGADHHDSLQLSSAYLNPTADMMQLLQRFGKVQLLTAGPMSHGFKPKDKAGNKGKAWIPAVFDHLAEDGLKMLSSPTATLHHWERDGWTFHAKGIWLREASNDKDQPVAAAIVGSSNFGERSFVRDMESNLVLVFPPEGNDSDSTVSKSFGKDWDDLLEYSNEVIDPKADSAALPWYIRLSFPFIKTFF
jgi:CDP-diacylglycerol--glycerol-3-phosphate 3-phosphatidyltransferase